MKLEDFWHGLYQGLSRERRAWPFASICNNSWEPISALEHSIGSAEASSTSFSLCPTLPTFLPSLQIYFLKHPSKPCMQLCLQVCFQGINLRPCSGRINPGARCGRHWKDGDMNQRGQERKLFQGPVLFHICIGTQHWRGKGSRCQQ